MAAGFGRPSGAVRWLRKTRCTAAQGGRDAGGACAVGKHTQRISTSGIWFALELLCQPGACY